MKQKRFLAILVAGMITLCLLGTGIVLAEDDSPAVSSSLEQADETSKPALQPSATTEQIARTQESVEKYLEYQALYQANPDSLWGAVGLAGSMKWSEFYYAGFQNHFEWTFTYKHFTDRYTMPQGMYSMMVEQKEQQVYYHRSYQLKDMRFLREYQRHSEENYASDSDIVTYQDFEITYEMTDHDQQDVVTTHTATVTATAAEGILANWTDLT